MSERICAVDGCDRAVRARDWCKRHWTRWRRTGDPGGVRVPAHLRPVTCRVNDCHRHPDYDGWCEDHWLTLVVYPLPAVFADPEPGWHLQAACYGAENPDAWYQTVGRTVPVPQVIKACAGCPVRGECLAVGLDEEFGVFGGLLPGDRKRVRESGVAA